MGRRQAARPLFLAQASRVFKQRRSQDTYQALLDGAEQVFAARGFEGAQTPEIAAASGVSTGAFYRYFSDKRQCFVEMVTRNLKRAHAEVTRKLTPALFLEGDPRQAIAGAIEVLFAHIERDAELERVYLAMSLRDPDVEALRTEYETSGLDALTRLIEAVAPRGAAPNARAAALVIQLASMEAASERAGLRPRLDARLPTAEVKAALREMLYRFLFCAPAADNVSSTRSSRGRAGRKRSGPAPSSRRGG